MTVCHLWRLSAQPTSPLNSVLVCFLLLFDLGRGFFEGGGGGVLDLLCVLCVFSRASQVVVQTNTAYRPSQSRAKLHKVCLICVVTLWCRMLLLCLVRCV